MTISPLHHIRPKLLRPLDFPVKIINTIRETYQQTSLGKNETLEDIRNTTKAGNSCKVYCCGEVGNEYNSIAIGVK